MRALRVMPLGDSITVGTGSATWSSYRLPLWNLVGAQSRYTVRYVGSQAGGQLPDLSHEGHSGYMIDDIRAGIDQWIGAAHPDVVLLHIGVNDLDRGTDPTHAADRLKTLVDQIFADEPGVAVIMEGVIPTTQGLQVPPSEYNSRAWQLQSVEAQAGHTFRYVDAPALTPSQMYDRLHPNDSGYSLMARAFYTSLDQAFTDGAVVGSAPPDAANDSGGLGRVRYADFDGDGKSDYVTISSSGAVNVWLNRGGDGHGGWQSLGQVAVGATTDQTRVRLADFDGDGRADYAVVNPNGSMQVYLNRGGDGHGGWQFLGQVAVGATTDQTRVKLADFDGDGRADYAVVNPNGSMQVYLNRGGDGHGGWQFLGQVAVGATTDQTRVKLADFDGDGRADYAVIQTDGSVQVYLNRGGDGHGGWLSLGQVAIGVTTDQDRIQFADFSGDGNADYIDTDPSSNSAGVYLWNGGDGHGGWNYLGQVAAGVPIA
ncbi:FG-GAP-like repeat-containing protein [Streptomyces sp. HPF1205]|uniref:FG-GAP-like repeat-containing protein n=1 Tax=Streptomyces sp. HPF1205 TaxID=2873262 RepID=UPI001CECD404|nr:FG-GAP-like repeat-containing protein [Streptomyces sp. HPF1205]